MGLPVCIFIVELFTRKGKYSEKYFKVTLNYGFRFRTQIELKGKWKVICPAVDWSPNSDWIGSSNRMALKANKSVWEMDGVLFGVRLLSEKVFWKTNS